MYKETGLLFTISMLLVTLRGEADAASYQRILLPPDHQLDPSFLAHEISSDASTMSLATCAGVCRMKKACFYFSVTEHSCQMYHRVHMVVQPNTAAASYYEVPAVLMLRQDISDGQFFPCFAGSWALNKHNENAMQYSRLDEIDNYLGEDGKYHLK